MPKRLTSEDIQRILEEKKSEQYGKIKKETERKMFIVRHREEIIKYAKLATIILIAIPFSIYFVVTLIGDIFGFAPWKFLQGEDENNQVVEVVEEEMPPEGFDIEVIDEKLIKTSKKRVYDVVSKVRNSNTEWGVSRLSYKFILKDKNDNKVGERERESYILPQQERYLVEVGIESLTDAYTVEVEINLKEVQKLEEFKNPQTQFEKSGVRYYVDNYKSRVGGDLINKSPFGFDKVDIVVIAYDLDGRIVGVNYTNVDDFLPGSNRYFSVFWNEIIANNINSVQIEIEPNANVFEAGKFMDLYGSGQALEY